jgi:peptidoglycan hydrolase CwlO-like protein
MNEGNAKIQPMLETIIEMLKKLQNQVNEINTRFDVAQADVAEIKAEQGRQSRQLDEMAKNLYRFAGDLYELRLQLKERFLPGISYHHSTIEGDS